MASDRYWPPIGLSRPDAAWHIGIGIPLFNKLVADGRMPRPRKIEGRLVWHRLEVEEAFTNLPSHGTVIGSGDDADNPFAAIRRKQGVKAEEGKLKAGRK